MYFLRKGNPGHGRRGSCPLSRTGRETLRRAQAMLALHPALQYCGRGRVRLSVKSGKDQGSNSFASADAFATALAMREKEV